MRSVREERQSRGLQLPALYGARRRGAQAAAEKQRQCERVDTRELEGQAV